MAKQETNMSKLKEELDHAEEYLNRTKKLTLQEKQQALLHIEEAHEHMMEIQRELEDSIEREEQQDAFDDMQEDEG